MEDIIRIDLEVLDDLARALSNLSDEIDELERWLRTVRYHMPTSVEDLVDADIVKQRRKMIDVMDRASWLAKRIYRVSDMFENCENHQKRAVDELETNAYVALKSARERGIAAEITIYTQKRAFRQSGFHSFW